MGLTGLYHEIHENHERAVRVYTIIHEVATGWMPTAWGAFGNPRLRRLYSYPGAPVELREGENHQFFNQIDAIMAFRDDYRLARSLIYEEEQQLIESGERNAMINLQRTALVSKIHGRMLTMIEQEDLLSFSGSLLDLHAIYDKTLKSLQGETAPPEQTIHQHKHVHLPNGGGSPTAIDWNAGLNDMGAVLTPQKALADSNVIEAEEIVETEDE